MHLVLALFAALAAVAQASVSRRHHHLHLHSSLSASSAAAAAATTTPEPPNYEEIDKMFVVDGHTGIHYNPYSKHHPGRHVCTAHKNVTLPVKTKQSFCKPVYKKYVERCNINQLCTGVKLVYETAYRDVVTTKTTNHVSYSCCPGWIQISNKSHGCNRPQCSIECKNGGTCFKPNFCSCTKGFTGRYCELDVNECKEQKPCDQICHNTPGSYRCECRENFILQNDGQSCRKEGGDGPAFEAKDLEYDSLDKRLFKLEMMLGVKNNNFTPNNIVFNMSRSLETLTKDVSLLQNKLKEIDNYKNDVSILKNKLNQLEIKNGLDEIWPKYHKTRARTLSNNKIYN